LQHVTTERVLAESAAGGGAIRSLQFAPRGDALLALDESTRLSVWPLHKPHPEISFAALLGRVWYENYPEPSHTWQSSGGSDDFEPKFSLVPLMFGTLKATAYSMFFAVPIAVLSAIYTSQFLSSHTRNLVKPAIEMMASLPSVVLGFIAALVLAPIVESRLLGALGLVILIPLAVWLAGHAWQLLPAPLAARLGGGARLLWAGGVILAAALLSFQLAPKVERLLFSGDIMGWLNQTVGSGAALWGLLTLPLALLVSFRLRSRVQMHIARGRLVTSGLLSEGAVELLSGLAALAAAAWMAWLVSAGLDALGLDLRGEVVGTYVQRNTLVVGFVMGFAVIPIIYTISEDALSAVPQHLKAGSLACGASVWQTALRVVLPIAGSGIFSATMIGLGRAAGETMIVVMAAGNTPIIDVNPFNGLRALSANIAVELPEAVKDGSLYRVLFLAGLALFGLTFVINTVAEIVRLRLRKRAHQL
jgi:phosphate transport system permease protein